ncbi:MAG: hypothetical protein C0624_08450 [Desulfuromonas sp.]|nr:MAG: hypothetical protein C0624_08450 [Desulfuromonas sp.]
MRSFLESINLSSDMSILLLVFFAIAFAVGALTLLLMSREGVEKRLSKLNRQGSTDKAPEKTKEKKVLIETERKRGLLDHLLSPLHRYAMPSEEALRRRVRLKLIQAGLRSKRAFRIYLGAKVLLTLLLPGTYLLSILVIKITPETMFIVATLAAVGLYLPNLVVNMMVSSRQTRILRALPDALDLMVICVESGLGLDMTFKRVGDELRPLCIDISDEFYLVNLEVRAGKAREEAYKHMSKRTGISEIHNLMTVLSQTSRFGTSVAKALRVHADAMRIRRRLNAEERAAKSSVKLVFPLIFFIFPAILVVLVGPAAIRIIRTLFPILG